MSAEQKFEGGYIVFRENRIRALEKILGKEYFTPSIRILEVGAGGGQTSVYFNREYGCQVTCTEGREYNLQPDAKEVECYIIDLEKETDWEQIEGRKFDLIIHWGVLYHLDNWENSLRNCVKFLADDGYLSLESELIDGVGANSEIKVSESSSVWDQALSSIGTRMTAANVERVLDSVGLTFSRYDDPAINVGFHKYDWTVNEKVVYDPKQTYTMQNFTVGLRRFWLAKHK
jgi:cyclopropane fatty-acyl-phospholipid synthase-like methyltransferase